MRPRGIAVIEDHFLQRAHTEKLIAAQPDMSLVFSGETLPAFTEWLRRAQPRERPGLIVLDLMAESHPNADPAVVKKLIADGHRIVLFSAAASPPLARQMLRAGVSGIIGKRDTEAEVLSALRTILRGEEWMSPEVAGVMAHDPRRPRLSDEEERILVLYASGLPIEAVAASVGVEKDTAEKYLQRVRSKYAAGRPVRTRSEMSRHSSADDYFALLPSGHDEPPT